MARNGKNQSGPAGPPARIRVGFARGEVVLARVGVGTGQEIWPFFSTKRLDWGKIPGHGGTFSGGFDGFWPHFAALCGERLPQYTLLGIPGREAIPEIPTCFRAVQARLIFLPPGRPFFSGAF